jgi:hypothetical protein
MIGEYASPLEDLTGSRWLTLAAEMAGLANGGGQPRFATQTLGADLGSVRVVRDFSVATLRRWGIAERSQDIAIVVSELLTNALRHGLPGSGEGRRRRPIRFGLLQPGSCVLCAVTDPSRAAPVMQTRGSLAETGRGLHIVCELSDQWGFTFSDTGKVVWAKFSALLKRRRLTAGVERADVVVGQPLSVFRKACPPQCLSSTSRPGSAETTGLAPRSPPRWTPRCGAWASS